MMQFQFCPVCASTLIERHLPTEDRPRLVCDSCGHVFYINPKVVAGTLPVENGKVWLLRRGIEPRLGYWTYPAGFQEADETTEEAAVRETWEEIRCRVQITSLFGVYSRAGAPVNVVYVARLANVTVRPSTTGEALEVRAFAPLEIPWEELAFPSTVAILQDWANSVTRGT